MAFDIGFVPSASDNVDCVVVFSPKDGVAAAQDRVEDFVYTVDPSAFKNKDGFLRFTVMARQFTLLPTYDAGEKIVSLTLIRD